MRSVEVYYRTIAKWKKRGSRDNRDYNRYQEFQSRVREICGCNSGETIEACSWDEVRRRDNATVAARREGLAAVVEIADKMQLAATQRPHPPPVPPRPSRQVVAEALKRSPRPPCPTRQAPPPPNTKPWRSDRDRPNNRQQPQPQQQQQVVNPAAGRTVVYESIKDSVPKETGNESGDRDDPARFVVDKSRSGGGNEPVPRVASERRADEDDHRGNPRERRHRSTTVPGQEYRGNSSESNTVTGDVVSSPAPRRKEDRSTPCREDSSAFERVSSNEHFLNGGAVTNNERSSSTNDNGKQCNDNEPANWDNSLSESTVSGSLDRSDVVGKSPTIESLDDALRCHHPSSSVTSESAVERSKSNLPEKSHCSERRPTPTQRSCLVKYQDTTTTTTTSTKKSAETRSADDSNVDRATVVVIDKPNRRATASNDDKQNGSDERADHGEHRGKDRTNENDNDNDNIHRQDWLEAGIHYSSTQIRLSGEDGDIVDGSRVNGYNRCENEKFSDINVPR